MGLAHENTMEAFRAGFDADADILEFDIRLTKDNVPVVIHDARLLRTHHVKAAVAHLTLDELREKTAANPVPTLQEVLDEFFGKIMLNIELKSRGTGTEVVTLLTKRYIKKKSDWDKIIISSFKGTELIRIRKLAPRVNLALLHNQNPFIFIAYHRLLTLTAVGFHRLYLNSFALQIAKRAGIFTYVYTVDRPGAIDILERQGVDGIVTNYPDKFRAALDKRDSK